MIYATDEPGTYPPNNPTTFGNKTIIAMITANGTSQASTERLRCSWEISGRRPVVSFLSDKAGSYIIRGARFRHALP